MELFRVGGDVPDTNYLFMGMAIITTTSLHPEIFSLTPAPSIR
jgi:hypothetical protein